VSAAITRRAGRGNMVSVPRLFHSRFSDRCGIEQDVREASGYVRTFFRGIRVKRMKTDYPGHDDAYRRLRTEGAAGWGRTEADYDEQRRRLRRILESGYAPRQGRLLELGCGAGNVAIWLARQGYEVVGVDIAPTAIEWARSKALAEGVRAEFLVGDVLDLSSVADAWFDFVLDGHCFHCIIEDDRSRFLAEALRVLRPGGFLLVDTMCGPVAGGRLPGYDEASRCTIRDGIATRYFGSSDDIKGEVESAGFRILALEFEAGDINGNLTIQAEKPRRV